MGNAFGGLATNGNRYGTTPNSPNLDFPTDNFTLELWFKGAAAGPLANKYDNTALKGYQIEVLSDGTARAKLNTTSITAGSSLLNSAWHHLALNVDRSSGFATLFVDGVGGTAVDVSAIGTIANSAAFQFGRDPAGSTTINGALSEIRLSSIARYSGGDFTVEVSSFEDDAPTRLLYHFWEGKGATIYDMSASPVDIYDPGTRHDATLVGGTGTWVFGPLFSNHVDILEAALWAAIDTDTDLNSYGSRLKLKRHRARRDDTPSGRQRFRGMSRDDAPGIFLYAQVGPIVPITHEFHDCTVPVLAEGALYNATKGMLRQLWWLMFRAINAREVTDAGHFYHQQVQKWDFRTTPMFNIPETDANSFMGRFMWQTNFIVRSDFRTAGSP